MELYWICVIAFLGVIVSGDDSCPNPAEIKPCTCDGEGLSCMGARTSDDIKKAFQAKFKYGAIRTVYVVGTPITSLPANTFGNIKCLALYIEINSISTINLRAFSASNKTLKTLSLYGNRIEDLNFDDFSIYEKVGFLNLAGNQLETIPDNAFNSQSLQTILLTSNKISHIGKNAFRNLPSLLKIGLSRNKLTTLGPMSFSLSSKNPALIELQGNQISDVSSSAFNATLQKVDFSYNRLNSLKYDSFYRLTIALGNTRGGTLNLEENPFTCQGCDYKWLVTNKKSLTYLFEKFLCNDGRELEDLTYSNIGCK